ncbi:MAG TPA: PQQ-like beta-propeller repeat protein [Candidatus Paceibacterota bacterium]|nr:PQQ-like beta-propeller repeat protein [Verrucomicrobiota bacterium]HSA12109.1 PQQ-like beta-propeller repeat protein [Candidatus Paceibacterota bacterium]
MKLGLEKPLRLNLLGLAGSLIFAATTTYAAVPSQNWPQWRGPLQNGVAPEATPPITWSETNNVKWKVRLPGGGHATPIIWEDRIFIQTAIPTGRKVETNTAAAGEQPSAVRAEPPPKGEGRPDGPGGRKGRGGFGGGAKPTEFYQFAVLCLDRQTGKVLWQKVAREEVPHEGYRQNEGSFASSSGLTDGKHLIACFGSRGLYCFDLNGKLLWEHDLGKMRMVMAFGEGSSPALHEDTLIVNCDNEDDSFIVALDKTTGKPRWKKTREERTSWSTPLIIQRDGKTQAVVAATGKIRSYDVASGDVIWECGGLTRNVVPCPVADANTVYCMSGFQGNALLAIRLGRTGDLTGTDAIAWTRKRSTPYVPSPLLYDGRLYFFAGNNGVLTCLDTKAGDALIDAHKLEDLSGVYASPLGAAGRVYLPGRNGVTVVLKRSDKLEVLAVNRLDEKFDASPVAVGKELFLRGGEHLYCLTEK